jgi:broad specificity phosphatase PhoE
VRPPYARAVLILLRHGRTATNADGRLQGAVDSPLDEVGHAEAMAAARVLAGRGTVVSSPLRRAVETASYLGADVRVDDRWRELAFGEYEERRVAEVRDELTARWTADPAYRPPGGESLLDLGRRIFPVCEELAAEAAEHDVVVVSHASAIKAALAWALGVTGATVLRFEMATASISSVRIRGGLPMLWTYNDTTHLGVQSPALDRTRAGR